MYYIPSGALGPRIFCFVFSKFPSSIRSPKIKMLLRCWSRSVPEKRTEQRNSYADFPHQLIEIALHFGYSQNGT